MLEVVNRGCYRVLGDVRMLEVVNRGCYRMLGC